MWKSIATRAALILAAVATLTAGFDQGGAAGDGKKAPATSSAKTPSSTGGAKYLAAFTGHVVFEGTVPPPRTIQVSKDATECRQAAGPVQDVVVGIDKSLSGVVVEVHGVGAGAAQWRHPKEGYVIRQMHCRFTPELLVVPDSAELTIFNDDAVLHNVNTGQWNIPQLPGAQPLKKTIAYEGRSFIRANCNIHSWMEMWIYVARSPFVTTTGADGKFRIEGLPAGEYKVTASHPTLGAKKMNIVVTAGRGTERAVVFRAP